MSKKTKVVINRPNGGFKPLVVTGKRPVSKNESWDTTKISSTEKTIETPDTIRLHYNQNFNKLVEFNHIVKIDEQIHDNAPKVPVYYFRILNTDTESWEVSRRVGGSLTLGDVNKFFSISASNSIDKNSDLIVTNGLITENDLKTIIGKTEIIRFKNPISYDGLILNNFQIKIPYSIYRKPRGEKGKSIRR
jgi:hypothetical protein